MLKIKNTKTIIIATLAALIVAGGGFYYFKYKNQSASSPTSNGPGATSATQAKKDTNAKKSLIESSNNTASSSSKSVSSKSIVLSARQESNGTVTLFTKLYNYSDGRCDLLVTNNSKSYSSSASVIYQTEFSSCAGFSIPMSKLGSGTWKIKVSVVSGSKTDSKAINFEVH